MVSVFSCFVSATGLEFRPHTPTDDNECKCIDKKKLGTQTSDPQIHLLYSDPNTRHINAHALMHCQGKMETHFILQHISPYKI